MITSELKKSQSTRNPGEITKSQRCNVACDLCVKGYDSGYDNILKGRKKYNGRDLCRTCRQLEQYHSGARISWWTTYNKNQIGKTLEERLGEEKARIAKLKQSANNAGKNNPNFGGKHSRGFADNPPNGKWEDRYGSEKANDMKFNMSQRNSGKNNPMYGKPSPPGSGNGWAGWYKGHHFRSLLELSYLKYLIDNGINFENGEMKKHRIELTNIQRTYFPDFYLLDTEEYIEVKPLNLINTVENARKFEAAKIKHGHKFRIVTENDINKLTLHDIIQIYECGDLSFIKRYEDKFLKYKESIDDTTNPLGY